MAPSIFESSTRADFRTLAYGFLPNTSIWETAITLVSRLVWGWACTTVRSHGWGSRSVTRTWRRSVFWKPTPKPTNPRSQRLVGRDSQPRGHTGQQSVTKGQTPEPEYTSVYPWRYTCVYRSMMTTQTTTGKAKQATQECSNDTNRTDRHHRHRLLRPRHGHQTQGSRISRLCDPRTKRRHRRHLARKPLPRLCLRRAIGAVLLLLRTEPQLEPDVRHPTGDQSLPAPLRGKVRPDRTHPA